MLVGAWLAGPLAAFSLSSGKQDHYILPIVPAAAIFAAIGMKRLVATGQGGRAGRAVLKAHAIGAILLGLIGPTGYVVGRLAPEFLARLGVPEAIARDEVLVPAAGLGGVGVAGGALALVLAARGKPRAALSALVATFAGAFLAAGPTLIGPMDRATTAAEFARRVRQHVPPDSPLLALRAANNTVLYYLDREVRSLGDVAEVRERAGRGEALHFTWYDKRGGKTAALLRGEADLELVVTVPNPYRPQESFWLFRTAGTAGPVTGEGAP
jgi:hypothetical protein